MKLLGNPVKVGGGAAFDLDLEELRYLVGVMRADVVLYGRQAGFDSLDQQERLVLPLELTLPVIEGSDRGHHRAACCQAFDDEALSQPLGFVSAARGHHDQGGAINHQRLPLSACNGRSSHTVALTRAMAPSSSPPITSDSQCTSRQRRSNAKTATMATATGIASARRVREGLRRRIANASRPYMTTARTMWPLGKLFPRAPLSTSNSVTLGPSACETDRGGPTW